MIQHACLKCNETNVTTAPYQCLRTEQWSAPQPKFCHPLIYYECTSIELLAFPQERDVAVNIGLELPFSLW